MSIKNGYKMSTSNGRQYAFVDSPKDAELRAQKDSSWGKDYTLTPARLAHSRTYWAIIDSENVLSSLYKIFSRGTSITTSKNPYADVNDEYSKWNRMIESGKSYLVGSDVPTKDFLKTHTSSCSDWQILACEWVVNHPDEMLIIRTNGKKRFTWHVCLRGEMIEMGMPHHDEGGEKYYVVNLKSITRKVLINVD